MFGQNEQRKEHEPTRRTGRGVQRRRQQLKHLLRANLSDYDLWADDWRPGWW